MKGYSKTAIVISNLMIDDHIKVAGVLYRITDINMMWNSYILKFVNARRPILQGSLTLPNNTLMHIWNQK